MNGFSDAYRNRVALSVVSVPFIPAGARHLLCPYEALKHLKRFRTVAVLCGPEVGDRRLLLFGCQRFPDRFGNKVIGHFGRFALTDGFLHWVQ